MTKEKYTRHQTTNKEPRTGIYTMKLTFHLKRTKKGRIYYGCEGYPDCEFMSWNKPIKEKCPECGSYMVEKGKKIACSDPECGYVRAVEE